MTVELKPLGNACNLNCTYCYEEPLRLAGNTKTSKTYDLDVMLHIAESKNESVAVFGGEALLVPIKDLEKIFQYSYNKFGYASVQTNGSLITQKHVELFKKYNVSIGISIDGPNDLNSLRVSGQKNKTTDELTQQTMRNISLLRENGISVSIIITLHKLNGTRDKLPRLLHFIKWLQENGIYHGNIHTMEVDSAEAAKHSLSEEENEWAFLELAKFFDENKSLKYTPFVEIESMMFNQIGSICLFNSCDPMNTQSVYGIEGNGAISNCGMVNKEGIEWHKADDQNYMRDILLYQTEQEFGGCKGCNYFLLCNGYCNGSALNGDWRNRTEFCSTLIKLFAHYETKVERLNLVPLSKNPFLHDMEEEYIYHLMQNKRLTLPELTSLYFMNEAEIISNKDVEECL